MSYVIGILPIKEHSERVPGKNFRELAGVPLWRWALSALIYSGVDKIIIDTDAPQRFRIKPSDVPVSVDIRDAAVRGDDVSMNRVIESVIARHSADIYIQIHATSPFLTAETMAAGLSWFKTHRCDSLFSVTDRRARFWSPGMVPINHDRDKLVPTQLLSPIYEENSGFYIFKEDSFRRTKNRLGRTPCIYTIPEIEGLDIDTEADWNLAELIMLGKNCTNQ